MSSVGYVTRGGARVKDARRYRFCFCRRRERTAQVARVRAQESTRERALSALSANRKPLGLAVRRGLARSGDGRAVRGHCAPEQDLQPTGAWIAVPLYWPGGKPPGRDYRGAW